MAMHSGTNRRFSFCFPFFLLFRLVRLLRMRVCTLFNLMKFNTMKTFCILYFVYRVLCAVCCVPFDIDQKNASVNESMLFSLQMIVSNFLLFVALLLIVHMNNGGFANWLGNEEMSVRAYLIEFDLTTFQTFQYSDNFSLLDRHSSFETRNQFSCFSGTRHTVGLLLLLVQLVYILQFWILPNAVCHIMSTFR